MNISAATLTLTCGCMTYVLGWLPSSVHQVLRCARMGFAGLVRIQVPCRAAEAPKNYVTDLWLASSEQCALGAVRDRMALSLAAQQSWQQAVTHLGPGERKQQHIFSFNDETVPRPWHTRRDSRVSASPQ